jgi:valyl-tRNA synthetase
MAPIMPHITEEIYQAYYREKEKSKSIHNTIWPVKLMVDEDAEEKGDLLVEALAAVRKQKTDNQMSLAKEVGKLEITLPNGKKDLLKDVEVDLKAAGKILEIKYKNGPNLSVTFKT